MTDFRQEEWYEREGMVRAGSKLLAHVERLDHSWEDTRSIALMFAASADMLAALEAVAAEAFEDDPQIGRLSVLSDAVSDNALVRHRQGQRRGRG